MNNQRGFSLVELMIAMAIVAIPAAVAIPSYTQYIIRTNRADAQDKLIEVMYELERFNTRNRTYTMDLTQLGYVAPFESDDGLYSISLSACGGTVATACVNASATHLSGTTQSQDLQSDGVTLYTLSLNTRGTRVGPWRR